MVPSQRDYPELIREVRRQLGLSQEDLARGLGVSFASVNRWENGQAKPSKLAQAQLDAFCAKWIKRGSLTLSDETGKGG
jgi:DNA-binding transcriptional regulator YiaG